MIVAIGDSITYGQFLEPPDLPWPSLIKKHDIRAAGVPSDTTRLALERFPADVQEVEPHAVIIQFGHNDANRWKTDRDLPRVSPKAYAANLEEMIVRCRTFGALPFLCTITPAYRTERHTEDVAYYDQVLRGVASAFGVSLIRVRETFLAAPAESRDELLMADGLHLTQEGHRLYAMAVQKTLDAWIK